MADEATDPMMVRTELAEGILRALQEAGVKLPPQVMEIRQEQLASAGT